MAKSYKIKKISAGFYEIEYKNHKVVISSIFHEIEKKTMWYATIDNLPAHDLYYTKKDCIKNVIGFIDETKT